MENNKQSKIILGGLVGLIIACSFFAFGLWIGEVRDGKDLKDNSIIKKVFSTDSEKKTDEEMDMALFWDVYEKVKEKYVNQDIDEKKLEYGAIEGMVSALGDKHSFFMTPEETTAFTSSLNNVYEGIGAYVGTRDDQITILAPLKNSPAEKAGIKAGDKIIKIGDKETEGMNIDTAVSLIRGAKNTKVKLLVYRESLKKALDIEITRDVVDVPSVEWETKNKNIGYVRINKFEKDTSVELVAAIKEMKEKGINKKVVVDLRNNPGGYLDTAVEVVGYFVGKGEIAVSEMDGNGKKTAFKTSTASDLKDWKVILLVNENSASASEILAGALRDLRGTKLVGKKTYGKGSVQEYITNEFKDGSSLKITVAKWLTPKGNIIEGEGIKPDYEVEITDQDFNAGKDPQLDKALELLQ